MRTIHTTTWLTLPRACSRPIPQRTAIGRQPLSELAKFKPFQTAEMTTIANIGLLETKMVDLLQSPTAVADVALRRKSAPLSDPRIMGAILTVPPLLSGLSVTEWGMVGERARGALHSEQHGMQQLRP
jgi:hypothetical protein